MKTIFLREMRAFFITPMGYVFLAAFIAVMNILFYSVNVVGKSADITLLFPIILIVLMVLTPTLTMRQFSEEYRFRTDLLLMTAPVRESSIVLAKFFAAFCMFLIALVGTLVWPIIVALHATLNMSEILGSYIAVFFAGAAFISLGIFISSLTESQIIASILTFAAFLAIYLLDTVAMTYVDVGWIKSIVRWFSLFSRYDGISRGLLALDDLLYYFSFTAVFLFLTVHVLRKKRLA